MGIGKLNIAEVEAPAGRFTTLGSILAQNLLSLTNDSVLLFFSNYS